MHSIQSNILIFKTTTMGKLPFSNFSKILIEEHLGTIPTEKFTCAASCMLKTKR